METEVIHTGPANYFRGFEAVGGKLTLYKDRLHFVSHGIAINPEPHTIHLNEITGLEKKSAWGLIPNGIIVVNKSGKRDRFVVHKRDMWLEKIETLIKQNISYK